jgi:hypothetical protein
MRSKVFTLNETDAVHVYSAPSVIWLQLRREHPTENDIGVTSFKASLKLTPIQAIGIAGELLAIAAAHHKATTPETEVRDSISEVPENHGKPWTLEEDKQLLSRFHSKLSASDIAKKHKRGVGGIQSRLVKLGAIPTGQNEQKNEKGA